MLLCAMIAVCALGSRLSDVISSQIMQNSGLYIEIQTPSYGYVPISEVEDDYHAQMAYQQFIDQLTASHAASRIQNVLTVSNLLIELGNINDTFHYENGDKETRWTFYGISDENIRVVDDPVMEGGEFEIVDGRGISQEDIEQNLPVCLVPNEFYRVNTDAEGSPTRKKVHVQDTISLYLPIKNSAGEIVDSYEATLTVVGKFNPADHSTEGTKKIPDLSFIILPEKTLLQLSEDTLALYSKNNISFWDNLRAMAFSPTAQIGSPVSFSNTILNADNFDQLKQLIPIIDEAGYPYETNLENMEAVVSNTSSLSTGMQTLLWVLLIISIGLSVLMSLMNLLYRRKETAILLSMGCSTRLIYIQMILEAMAEIVPGMFLALPLGQAGIRVLCTRVLTRSTALTSTNYAKYHLYSWYAESAMPVQKVFSVETIDEAATYPAYTIPLLFVFLIVVSMAMLTADTLYLKRHSVNEQFQQSD